MVQSPTKDFFLFRLVVVDDMAKLDNVLAMKERTPELKHVVLVDKPEDAKQLEAIEKRAKAAGISLHMFEDLEKADPQQEPGPDHPPKPEDNYIVWSVSGRAK